MKYQRQLQNTERELNFDIKTKILSVEINEFIVLNLNLIKTAMEKAGEIAYKTGELNAQINVFVIKRVPQNVLEVIDKMNQTIQISIE